MPGFGLVKARGEMNSPGEKVALNVQYLDGSNAPINTDSFPTIALVMPSGGVMLTPTSAGVSQVGIGLYQYIFDIPINGPYGVWNDVWSATINGDRVNWTSSFIINYTDVPGVSTDGYIHVGDDVGFNYSQTAIFNINKLIKMMKARLNSSGKSKKIDPNGNVQYVDCDIYSVETLTSLLAMSLSKFNSIPYFTSFTFESSDFFVTFGETIVEGAIIYALASQALIERGREFQLSDNGINFTPPSMSEILTTQYTTELNHWYDYAKMIKASMRPGPLSLGRWGMEQGSNNPAIRRLRFRREGRIL